MKSICCIAVALVIAAAALAQETKPGDFALNPLPPQEPPSAARKARVVARRTLATVNSCGTNICSTNQPHACIEVNYTETAWRTCISNQGRRGIVIGPTDLRRSATGPWMRVLREAGVAEILVPYHVQPWRLYDMRTATHSSMHAMTPADAGPNGTLVTLSGQQAPQVVAEVNDRGLAWLCKETRHIVRRGQELVLWGVQDAQNYDHVMEYRLRDDGSIGFRLGATGFNNVSRQPESTTEAHMHSILWRVDVDLNGSGGDSAKLITHQEGESRADDLEEPFNGGREGVAEWDPKRFLGVAIEDSSTNAHQNAIGYKIRANPEGLSRHAGIEEEFTQFDFAVTRYKELEREVFFDSTGVRWLNPDQYLLGQGVAGGFGVANSESTEDTDIILWYRSSTHHDPHDEDHAPGDPSVLMTGVTLMHWTGFDLEPHNLFDFNPLGGPSRLNCW